LLLVVAALAAGCASTPAEPESMRDPGADFGAYRTFGWATAPVVSDADAPLLLLDQNIRAAIAAELKRRGYVESAEIRDLGIGKGSLEPAAITAAVSTAMRDFPSRPAP
jgi:hypothetical protein